MVRSNFEIGDVVRVKGINGPHMVVRWIGRRAEYSPVAAGTVWCVWFDVRKRVQFWSVEEPELLELVPEESRFKEC